MLLAALALVSLSAQARVVSYVETFDDDSSFSADATLPDGWKSENDTEPVKRYAGSYLGTGSHSGNYVLGTMQSTAIGRSSWVFTPLRSYKAGVTYTVSFWLCMPGGTSSVFVNNINVKAATAQRSSAATISLGTTGEVRVSSWTQQSYTFTPTEDGTYCIAFNITTQLYQAGAVAIDDVEITGDEPEVIPEADPDKVVCELPYSQSFDNENGDYDGSTEFVPHGWLATGTYPFRTANITDLEAKDGTYYVVAPESSVARDDRLYTSFFLLHAGTTYTAKFYLYMPGDEDRTSNFDFTVGKEQDADFHTALLSLENVQTDGWKEITVSYTPEETHYYCFSFALSGESIVAGEAAIDFFTLSAPGLTFKPRAAFSFNGYFSQMNSGLTLIDMQEIKMVNQTTDGESYEWKAPGAIPSSSTEAEPTFAFPTSGSYTIQLTATNAAGSSTTSETFNVNKIDTETGLPLTVYNPGEETLMTRDQVPYFSTAEEADYVTGVNHYYTSIAERFALPEERTYQITALTLYLCYYNIANRHYAEESNRTLSVVVYGEKDGRPDLSNVYGKYETTLNNAFGTMGLSKAELRTLSLPTPLTATGPFYIALEFDPNVCIDEEDASLTRTIVGLGGFYHRSMQTTLYVKPTAVPDGASFTPDGGYCLVDQLDAAQQGIGLNITAWINVGRPEDASIAITPDGHTVFDAAVFGNNIRVSGTQQGETIRVVNAAGQVVLTRSAEAQATSIDAAALPHGVYVVHTAHSSRRVLK